MSKPSTAGSSGDALTKKINQVNAGGYVRRDTYFPRLLYIGTLIGGRSANCHYPYRAHRSSREKDSTPLCEGRESGRIGNENDLCGLASSSFGTHSIRGEA